MGVYLHIHTRDGIARVPLRDKFEESKHPRGQPTNKGEFVAKGSGTRGVGKKTVPKATTKQVSKLVPKKRSWAELVVPAPLDRSEWPAHIKAIGVPPKWTDIKINMDPKAEKLVLGKDSKNRPQYLFSQEHWDKADAKKFAKVKKIAAMLPTLQKANNSKLNSKDAKVSEHADCLGLIMATGIRPGSERDTGAEKQAYGATTLRGDQFVEEKGKVYLRFVGKKGKDLNIHIDDPEVALAIARRAKSVGPDGQLFSGVDDKSLRKYSKSISHGVANPKDFRTVLANSMAYNLVRAAPVPTNAAQYKKAVNDVAKAVSEKLGNTPAVCLKSYINPYVFIDWRIVEKKGK